MINKLSDFGQSQPQAAYPAFTHGVRHKMTYFMRTIEGLDQYLQPLDKLIDEKFIPALFGCPITPLERRTVALPVRCGGLGIPVLTKLASEEYQTSIEVTKSLVKAMAGIETELDQDSESLKEILKVRAEKHEIEYTLVCNESSERSTRALKQAREKGSSSWLTVLPLKSYGFTLNKGEFRDSLLLRYKKDLQRLPLSCVCGAKMDINHSLNCPRGGYIIIRHNAVRDFFAKQKSTVCKDVECEPHIQTLDGETFSTSTTLTGDNAHPDIRARGFYRPEQNFYFDIKFLNPNSESYLSSSTEKIYERAETQKRRLYNERILNVEHGSFCPLVYSVTGGSGPEARTIFRLLCEKISHKTQQNYSDVVNFLRCKLSFVIRKLVLLCIRGTRSSINTVDKICESDFEFACFVSKLS